MKQKTTTRSLICGLEVHAELATASKMFCGCVNDPFHADKPNIHTCPVCLGMPGGLPIPNHQAILWTIKLGLALNCKINLESKFDRKHYFYPDLAKGYQISQYDQPFCYDGYLETSEGKVRIRRIHLEEDTGKLQHTNLDGQEVSLVDFNRGGVPLVEIVTEPDIKSPAQAKEYGKKLRQILRYLNVAECDMEKGGMRLEANISLQESGAKELPDYKVEVKNINSFKFLEQAISFEVDRQDVVLDEGETPPQETRGWDSQNNQTVPQRIKEEAADYRYFPDPDIPPLVFEADEIEKLRSELPELPDSVAKGWFEKYQIKIEDGLVLSASPQMVTAFDNLFEKALEGQKIEPLKIANALINHKVNSWLLDDVKVKSATDSELSAEILAVLKAATELYATATVDSDELAEIVQNIIKDPANKSAVDNFKAGKTSVIGFFLGAVMRKLGKKVDPQLVRTEILKALG